MKKHIAIDLDGTLAHYDGWKGKEHIGDPIPAMVNALVGYLFKGGVYSIFTARCTGTPAEIVENREIIMKWVHDHSLPLPVEVTAIKRKHFSEFWDDRAFHVRPNTGKLVGARTEETSPVSKALHTMADTFEERNKVYGDNYKVVGELMAKMYPDGVTLKTPDDFNRWHLFELMVVKLSRFTQSGLTHKDSIHDLAVYAAMVESLTNDKEIK